MSLYVDFDSYDDEFYGTDILGAVLTLGDLLTNPDYEGEYSDVQDELDRYVLLRDTVMQVMGANADNIHDVSIMSWNYYDTTYAHDQVMMQHNLDVDNGWQFFDFEAWKIHHLGEFNEFTWEGTTYLAS